MYGRLGHPATLRDSRPPFQGADVADAEHREHGEAIVAAASQSVSSAPTASASGPATMSPSGIRTNDPSASYE